MNLLFVTSKILYSLGFPEYPINIPGAALLSNFDLNALGMKKKTLQPKTLIFE